MKHVPSLSPRFVFIALTLCGWLGLALFPTARSALGVSGDGRWFVDSHAVLAAIDADRAGLAPDAPNPLDVYGRSHKYSDGWLLLGRLGLTRADNFLVGGTWVVAFATALFLTIRPRSMGAAFWMALLAVSPPVMLGIERANNDLVIFAILAVALPALRSGGGGGFVLATAAIALATGLKFYPAVALGVLFTGVLDRRAAGRITLAGLAVGLVLIAVADQIGRGTFRIEPEIYSFGARVWLMGFALAEPLAVKVSIAGFALAVAGAAWRIDALRAAPSANVESDHDEARAFALGASLLAACFVTGVSHGYRLIFVLWLAPWIWLHRRRNPVARLALWLAPLVLWGDGLLCLATELFFPALAAAQYERILLGWWRATQPVTWSLMGLLGGWVVARVVAWWKSGAARSGAE